MNAVAEIPFDASSSRSGSASAVDPHPLAAATWLAAGLVMLFVTSNPFYTGTIGLCAIVVYIAHRRRDRRRLDLLLVIGVAFTALTVPLNLLTGSSGATPLFDLPTITLPGWLASVRFGGTVTAESLVYAVAQATGIAAIVALVCAFNAAVDHFRLLRLVPPGLAQLGIIVTIGLLLIPETLVRAAALHEARIVRGHHRGLRALPSLVLPLLAEALERSVQRAESLDARGFGRLSSHRGGVEALVAVAGIVSAAFGAFAYHYSYMHALSLVCLVAGGAAVAIVVWRQSRAGGAVRMRHSAMSAADVAVMCAACIGVSMFIALRVLGAGGLTYVPFPTLYVPPFEVAPAIACLLLLAPVVRSTGSESP
mgnify:CR=1 FL=1